MKSLGLLFISVCLLLVAGCAVDHSGIRAERHGLEVDANTVRVELRDFIDATVVTTGDPRTEGELHRYSVEFSAAGPEFFFVDYIASSDIENMTKGIRGDGGYVEVDVGDFLRFTDGNRTDVDGELPLKPTPWVNLRRGATIEIRVESRDLDCSRRNVCRRGNTGSVTFEMNIPPLPDPLPTTCQQTNSFQGRQVNGVYGFEGMVDPRRIQSGNPIIEPGVTAFGASLCFLPPE